MIWSALVLQPKSNQDFPSILRNHQDHQPSASASLVTPPPVKLELEHPPITATETETATDLRTHSPIPLSAEKSIEKVSPLTGSLDQSSQLTSNQALSHPNQLPHLVSGLVTPKKWIMTSIHRYPTLGGLSRNLLTISSQASMKSISFTSHLISHGLKLVQTPLRQHWNWFINSQHDFSFLNRLKVYNPFLKAFKKKVFPPKKGLITLTGKKNNIPFPLLAYPFIFFFYIFFGLNFGCFADFFFWPWKK